jgi:hypothetical protein
MNLTLDDRTKIFDKVCRLVETKHFNPGMNGVDWNALVRDRRDQILACIDPEVFEKEVHKLLASGTEDESHRLPPCGDAEYSRSSRD